MENTSGLLSCLLFYVRVLSRSKYSHTEEFQSKLAIVTLLYAIQRKEEVMCACLPKHGREQVHA